MKASSPRSPWPKRGRFRRLPLVVASVLTAGGGWLVPTTEAAQMRVAPSPSARPAPSADEFARIFVVATNRYAEEHGDRRRIGRADCVQAARGRYMWSYTAWVPGSARLCHLMQGRWTPHAASSVTITLAGRVEECSSLRDALDSLASRRGSRHLGQPSKSSAKRS